MRQILTYAVTFPSPRFTNQAARILFVASTYAHRHLRLALVQMLVRSWHTAYFISEVLLGMESRTRKGPIVLFVLTSWSVKKLFVVSHFGNCSYWRDILCQITQFVFSNHLKRPLLQTSRTSNPHHMMTSDFHNLTLLSS